MNDKDSDRVQGRRVELWCERHGWTQPRREGLFWVAWPPGGYLEVPIPPEVYRPGSRSLFGYSDPFGLSRPQPPVQLRPSRNTPTALRLPARPRSLTCEVAAVRLLILALTLGQIAYVAGVCLIFTNAPTAGLLTHWSIYHWTGQTPSTFPLMLLMSPLIAATLCLLGERLWTLSGRLASGLSSRDWGGVG
ncbi:hypothetical protein [Gloeobacter kilaueensis]|uniref:Uncharacterized protein n=1 Tax=Gloeobacter kilaueensis (strain ATCC BAA-2537 / CCAP 1431/1 / ULC 316 / JS1) TaxID=1183438 RepID=U5QG39_GLOK1|nr:hypothetical protein [Gloeobacter kilaueensis]AGY57927.1 hypothetical protein GKIL_1681 [Gloeobacter kilaueensis JS1]